MDRYLLVMAGAAVGGLLRYILSTAILQRYSGRFPMGTFLVNISGCFLIGIMMTLLTERNADPRWRFLLVVGVLGGYTTFSSFGWETYQAVREGYPLMGLFYAVSSVAAGYLAVWCGAVLARR
jgi:CrcB protein